MSQEKKDKYLILLDLDGTTLNKDYKTFNSLNKKVLNNLTDKGHIVCIATGKNYLSALPFYKEIGLDSYIATNNGSYVSNPSHPDKPKFFAPISNQVVKSIIEDEKVNSHLKEYLIDSQDNETISTSENVYWKEVFFNNNPNIYKDAVKHLGSKDALQIVLEFPNEKSVVNGVISALRKYRSAISFNFINKLKKGEGKDLVHDPDSAVIRIRSSFANKGIATEWLSSYYGIPLSRTIAIGDDKNDVEMISTVGYGIAMSNGTLELKSISHTVTKLDNHAGGAGMYLAEFFGIPSEELKIEA